MTAAAQGAAPPAGGLRLGVGVGLVVLWLVSGSNFLAFKVAVESIPPFLMAGARLLAAGVLLLPVALLRRPVQPDPIRWPQLRSTAVAGVLMLAVGQGALVWGVRLLPAGVTAMFASSAPLWLAVFGWMVWRDPLPGRTLLGVALGFAGLVGLSLAGGDGEPLDFAGVAAVLGGAMAFALGALYAAHASMPHRALLSTALEMLIAGAVLSVAALAVGEWSDFSPSEVTARSWTAFAYLVLVGSMIGFGLFVWLNATTSPTLAGTFNYVAPVVALPLGFLLLDEPVTAAAVAACAVTLTGVALMVGTRRPSRPVARARSRPAAARPCTQ